jgi:hypothetical protein
MARTNHLKPPKKTSVIHHPWLRVAAVGCWRSPCCGRSRPGWRRGAWLCDWVGSLHCGAPAPPAPERRSLERPGEKCPLTGPGPLTGPKCWWPVGVICWVLEIGEDLLKWVEYDPDWVVKGNHPFWGVIFQGTGITTCMVLRRWQHLWCVLFKAGRFQKIEILSIRILGIFSLDNHRWSWFASQA